MLLRGPGDERFVVIGRAAEFSARRRETRTLELPGDGTYLLLFRSEGRRDRVVRVTVAEDGEPILRIHGIG